MEERHLLTVVRGLLLTVLIILIGLYPAPVFAATTVPKKYLIFGAAGALAFFVLIFLIGGALFLVRARRLKAQKSSAPDLMLTPETGEVTVPPEGVLSPAEAILAQSREPKAEMKDEEETAALKEAGPEKEAAPVIDKTPASPPAVDVKIQLADAPPDIIRFVRDVMSGTARNYSTGTIYKGEQVMVTYDNGQFVLEYLDRPEKLIVAEGVAAAQPTGSREQEISPAIAGEEEMVPVLPEAEDVSPEVNSLTGQAEAEVVFGEVTPAGAGVQDNTSEAKQEAIPTIMLHRDALKKEQETPTPPETAEAICPDCGEINDASLDFCLACGGRMSPEAGAAQAPETVSREEDETSSAAEQTCPVCGSKFSQDIKVCPSCGVKIL